MNLLGSVGQLYMFVLLVLLFLGSGFALWGFVNFLMARRIQKQGKGENLKSNGQNKATQNNNILNIKKGGLVMANNGWIKLAVFSLVGIIVSVAILGMVSTSNSNMQGMNMNIGTTNQSTNQHQGMQQNGTNSNMNMQGGMNVNTQMGNMQAQGNMNMTGATDQNQMLMMMQQNMYQMQMQINQIQQQIGMQNGNMNGSSQMQQNGNMNNMPQNSGNSNMQQNSGSSNMQQSSGSSSSGMGMM